MYTLRLIILGTILAGVLAGINALDQQGIPNWVSGSLLVSFALVVGLRMVGGLTAQGKERSYLDAPPPYEILEQGYDKKGRPFFVIQGTARDATQITEGWTYPGSVYWVHQRLGPYRWKIHLRDYEV